MNYFILLCGGIGKRFGTIKPKQYQKLYKNKPVFYYSLKTALESEIFDYYFIAADSKYFSYIKKYMSELKIDNFKLVQSGESRQQSVFVSLSSVLSPKEDDIVFIHDSVRPLVKKSFYTKLLIEVKKHKSAIPYSNEHSSIYDLDSLHYLDRTKILSVETPQCFFLKEILIAHQKAILNHITDVSDDGYLYQKYLRIPNLVYNPDINIKITNKYDLIYVKEILKNENR